MNQRFDFDWESVDFSRFLLNCLNSLPPSDAVRKQNKNRGPFQFSIVTIQKYHTPGNLKFNNLGIFQSLKLRISKEKKSFQFLLS